MQFDLFNGSDRVALRNDVILTLAQGHATAAHAAWCSLRQHFPEDNCLETFQVLIETESQRTSAMFRDHDALHDARVALAQTITPAAQCCLGQQAEAWLRSHWQNLAQRAAHLNYRADTPDDHAAPLWLRAGNWQACAESVSSIVSWRRIPPPLSWMLQARLKTQGLLANWGLLAELAWMSPQRLQAVIQQSDDPILLALVAKFELNFEDSGDVRDLAWFAAWVLTEQPALASALTLAQASQHSEPEQAMRVLLELLGLERQGRQRDIVEARKSLRGLHGALYAAYLATR
jgi:hypothetical protein